MENQIISENVVLLYFIATGAFITFIYDIFRILRNVYKHHWILISMEDVIFWCFCAIMVFILLQRENNGVLRWFSILGAISGMFAYHKLIGQYFVQYGTILLQKWKNLVDKPIHLVTEKCTSGHVRINRLLRHVNRRIQLYTKDLRKVLKIMVHKK